MKKGEVVAGLFFMAVGMAFAFGAVKLEIGTLMEPQPGFFPFWDGIILVILSLLFVVHVLRGGSGGGQAFGKLKGPALLIFTMILYVAALDNAGYVVTTTILGVVVLKILETPTPNSVLMSLVLAVGSYLLFDRLLGVPLPAGILAALF